MEPLAAQAGSPRKRPRQARAGATFDAICEATIHILLADGPAGLTTTKVAIRAGVSVGSLYQYFGNRESLLYSVTERYLQDVATDVEDACARCRDRSLEEMTATLVRGYWGAKRRRADITRALYRANADIDPTPLVDAFCERIERASHAMFATATGGGFVDTGIIRLTLLSALYGTVRQVFERGLPDDVADAAETQLIRMLTAYLATARE